MFLRAQRAHIGSKTQTEQNGTEKTGNMIVSSLNPIGRRIIMKLPKFKNPLNKEELL